MGNGALTFLKNPQLQLMTIERSESLSCSRGDDKIDTGSQLKIEDNLNNVYKIK